MLFDRENELEELNLVLGESGARFLTVSGRRRLVKITLLVEWPKSTGLPAVYWVASRVSTAKQRPLRSYLEHNHKVNDVEESSH